MEKINWFKILSIVLVTSLFMTGYADAASFSSQGFDDVISASGSNVVNAGLSNTDADKRYLAAIIMAPTWLESVDYTQAKGYLDKTPLPMTLGRNDKRINDGYQLWVDGKTGYDAWNNKTQYFRRVHHNAHRGMWALDGAGMGRNVSLLEAIDTSTAAPIVAAKIAQKYKNATGTLANKRKAAWNEWYACDTSGTRDGQKCEQVFNAIYDSTNKTLNITKDTSVTRRGGITQHTCNYSNIPESNFTCYRWDATKVEGNNTSKSVAWLAHPDGYNPNNGDRYEPLPLPFYFFKGSTNATYVWFRNETGYSQDKVSVWNMSTNPRSGVTWSSTTQVRLVK